jgi:hypothetical protein
MLDLLMREKPGTNHCSQVRVREASTRRKLLGRLERPALLGRGAELLCLGLKGREPEIKLLEHEGVELSLTKSRLSHSGITIRREDVRGSKTLRRLLEMAIGDEEIRSNLAHRVGAPGHGRNETVRLAVRPVMDVLIRADSGKSGSGEGLEVRGILGNTSRDTRGASLRGHFGLIHSVGEKINFYSFYICSIAKAGSRLRWD